jgi:hypothetical protein
MCVQQRPSGGPKTRSTTTKGGSEDPPRNDEGAGPKTRPSRLLPVAGCYQLRPAPQPPLVPVHERVYVPPARTIVKVLPDFDVDTTV